MRIFSRGLRILSAITLFFFCWTFLPLYSFVAYAAANEGPGSGVQGPGHQGSGARGNGPERPDEQFEKALDAIRENVATAEKRHERGEDDKAEREQIRAKRTELESLDVELRKEFSETEKKLKQAKLPKVILDRHYRFVKHYEDNLKELKTNLDGIEKAGTKSERRAKIGKAKLHLDKTRPPRKHVPLDPNNLPFSTVKGKERAPRLKQEEFEKEFGPQRRRGINTADATPFRSPLAKGGYEGSVQSRIGANGPTPSASPFIKGGQEGDLISVASRFTSDSSRVLLAFNGPASDMPLQLPHPSGSNLSLPVVGEGWGLPSSDLIGSEGANSFLASGASLLTPDASRLLIAQATVDLPTAADLAETPEVQFTPEIRALAAQLDHNPVKIYEWVRNNINYEPYYGSLKGAQQTLLEGAGNDFDQASLLIAMLRFSNIPAKYAYGTVEISMEKVMSWLGVINPMVAGTILSSNGIPTTLMKTSGGVYKTVRLEHCWVSAYVNMLPSLGAKNNLGNMWTPLDVSFKDDKITAKIDLSKLLLFNEAGYLSSHSNIPPSLSYLLAAEDYHTANYTGNSSEIFYLKQSIKRNFEIFLGTLPYQPITITQQFSDVPDGIRHKIDIYLTDQAMNKAVTVQKNMAEITGRKLAVSYVPASQQDEATINNYGGILKTPAYLIKVKPAVKLDSAVILEGPTINLGTPLRLIVAFINPGMSTQNIETDISVGVYYCIGIAALNPSQDQLSDGLNNLMNLSGSIYESVNMRDNRIEELLYNIAIQYFGNVLSASRYLQALMHIQDTNIASGGFVSVKVRYTELFGIPSSPATITGLNLDLQRYIHTPFSITGDNDKANKFMQIHGLTGSFYEHRTMEMMSGIESVSAVKALQIANEAGIPIYKISSSNIDTILPLLTVSQEIRTDIQNAINAGKEVTISRDNVQINDWIGAGFIVRDPNTGEGAYMISNGSAGSDTTQPPVGALGLLAGLYAALVAGTPENINNLTYDLVYMESIGDMLLAKGYIKKVASHLKNQKFVEFANNKRNWIFYYSGHGTTGHLCPEGYEPCVSASEINADAHIIFLNSCNSGLNSGLAGAFGLNNSPGPRVFLGFTGVVDWFETSSIAHSWWRNMYEGDDAQTAINDLPRNSYTDYQTTGPKLIRWGDAQAKL